MLAALLPLLLAIPWLHWDQQAEVRMTLQVKAGAADQARLVDETVRALSLRLYRAGIRDAEVSRAGEDRITVYVPAVTEPDRVRKLARTTGLLELRLVRAPKGGGGAPSREALLADYEGGLPADLELLEGGGALGGQDLRYFIVERQTVIVGHDISNARSMPGQFGKPIVYFTVTPEAARNFSKVTGDNIGSGLAIVFDGKVLSAPVINARISDAAIIEGDFTETEVKDMAAMMSSGPLPSQVSVVDEKVVRPSPSARRTFTVVVGGTALGVLTAAALFILALRRR
jgi:protein-export membrane protein SecD